MFSWAKYSASPLPMMHGLLLAQPNMCSYQAGSDSQCVTGDGFQLVLIHWFLSN